MTINLSYIFGISKQISSDNFLNIRTMFFEIKQKNQFNETNKIDFQDKFKITGAVEAKGATPPKNFRKNCFDSNPNLTATTTTTLATVRKHSSTNFTMTTARQQILLNSVTRKRFRLTRKREEVWCQPSRRVWRWSLLLIFKTVSATAALVSNQRCLSTQNPAPSPWLFSALLCRRVGTTKWRYLLRKS